MRGEDREALAAIVARIERELRALGVWEEAEASPVDATGAFGGASMPFESWLQRVLLPRLRDVLDGRGELPEKSHVGTAAVRNFDGWDEADALVSALAALDALVNADA